MTEEYLQVAFEIKATCDEISRRLLRWHWEQKPGVHSFDSLLKYIAERREESPTYYDRLPDLTEKTSWQQLDTTVCMRVLLDPEQDAAHPVDLIGNTAHPAAARRACNAVRVARNEAAHASDSAGAQQAGILFNEAVESLEEGYANSALQENELARYYRRAEDFLARLSGEDAGGDAEDYTDQEPEAPQPAPAKSARRKTAESTGTKKSRSTSTGSTRQKQVPARTKTAGRSTKNSPKAETTSRRSRGEERRGEDRAIAVILLLAVALGLGLRACGMI